MANTTRDRVTATFVKRIRQKTRLTMGDNSTVAWSNETIKMQWSDPIGTTDGIKPGCLIAPSRTGLFLAGMRDETTHNPALGVQIRFHSGKLCVSYVVHYQRYWDVLIKRAALGGNCGTQLTQRKEIGNLQIMTSCFVTVNAKMGSIIRPGLYASQSQTNTIIQWMEKQRASMVLYNDKIHLPEKSSLRMV